MVEKNVRTYNTSKRCYIFHDFRLPFETANQHCMAHHTGTLAIPNDNEYLSDIFFGLTNFNDSRIPFYRIGLSRQNNETKWINKSEFTGDNVVERPDAAESCVGFAIRDEEDYYDEFRFHSFNCSEPVGFVCEKQNQKTIEKPTTPRATTKKSNATKLTPTVTIKQVNVVENSSIGFQSTTVGSSNTLLLASCISAACVILALIAVAIFLIVKKKRNHNSGKNPNEKVEYYCTAPLRQEDTGRIKDFSSDYATVEEEEGYSSVPLDYDHLVLNPSSACPQAMYSEVDKEIRKPENVDSDDSSNAAPEQNEDVKALYATVNKNR